MIDLREYNKLKDLMIKHQIPFEEKVIRDFPFKNCDWHQLIYPKDGDCRRSDAVIHFGSYGHDDGLLEQMGLLPNGLDEDVQGWLDAETIFKRWAEDYGYFIDGMEV